MSEKKGLIGRIKKIDFSYHFNLFVRSLTPTLSLLSGMAFMIILIPSTVTAIFMFGLSYTEFLARIMLLVFMYNLGNFFVREITVGAK